MTEDESSALLYAADFSGKDIRAPLVVGRFSDRLAARYPNGLYRTPYAGEAAEWERAGYRRDGGESVDSILLFLPQQTGEADAAIAGCLDRLNSSDSPLLMIVASNDAGGKTLRKRLESFGCPVADMSKHKCRVVWTESPRSADKKRMAESLEKGGIQCRSDGLLTQPGVFSWDRRDRGSSLLLQHIPPGLCGIGADFGCGIGDLSRFLLETHPGIERMECFDHDERAVACCRENLAFAGAKVKIEQRDIIRLEPSPVYDFIVMNPPFHKGKAETRDLGAVFIRKAAESLKKKGVLRMVSNAHLPYGDVLDSCFSEVQTVAQADGFKIRRAVR